jgi:hypothetical protein
MKDSTKIMMKDLDGRKEDLEERKRKKLVRLIISLCFKTKFYSILTSV